MVRSFCFLSFLLMLALQLAAVPLDQAGPIDGMQLITREVGWLASGNHLFRTNDAGKSWTGITPQMRQDEAMTSVFFLNPSTGWSVIGGVDPDDAGVAALRVAQTHDGGKHWSSYNFGRDCEPCRGGVGTMSASVTFLDRRRGWVVLGAGVYFHAGVLFSTSDGGKTWRQQGRTPVTEGPRFVDPKHGWLIGSESNGSRKSLFATRDGGRTWQQQHFPEPTMPGEKQTASFGLPVFRNRNNGRLAVGFTTQIARGLLRARVIEYVTRNGGSTWEVGREFPATNSSNNLAPPVIAKQDVIWGVSRPEYFILAHGNRIGEWHSGVPGVLIQLQFVDANHGWVQLNYDYCAGYKCDCYELPNLLFTSDGGKTFAPVKLPEGGVPPIVPCEARR